LSDEFLSPNPDGHPANYRLIHENFGWSRGTFVVLQDFDYAHQFQHVTRERIHYYRKLDPQLALNFGLLAQILQAHNGKLRTQLPDEPAEYHGLKELLGDSYEDLRVVDITHPQSGWRFPYWGPSLGVAKYTTQATELVRDTDVWMSVDEEIPF
jgi:hypothetical protein